MSRFSKTEVIHAVIYLIIGCVGFVLSVCLIFGISRRECGKIHPWIIIQILNIGYQLYFTFEFIQTTFLPSDSASYSSLIIAMVLIFHIVFEGYYLCFIIGISQFIANYRLIQTSRRDHETVNLKNLPNHPYSQQCVLNV